LFIILVIFITNLSAVSADYNNVETQKNIANGTYQGCPECRRVRKRFAKPITRYAKPKPAQKAGYYKTGMSIRYPKQIQETKIQASRFNKNYTISQVSKASCNGITFYSENNICK
jgi:hypothetical protein